MKGDMLTLRTIADIERIIPQMIWPVKSVIAITHPITQDIIIDVTLPWWEPFTFGILRHIVKNKVMSLCAIHGIIGVNYNVICV